jgi:CheY-like chemotaxis protein
VTVAKKIIVIVDDEPGLCETIQDYLEDEGYDVRIALDGAQALTVLHDLPQKPCMVLCDIIMPVMDGVTLFRTTRADPVLGGIAFVFTSTDPSRAPSGEPFMRKPLNFEQILDTVRRCCGPDASLASA